MVPVPRTVIVRGGLTGGTIVTPGSLNPRESDSRRKEPTHVPRILLVDDSNSARHIIAAKLREHGYEVTDAPEATSAAELALTKPPHAVVTDLWMPGISGLQLCRLLRADP